MSTVLIPKEFLSSYWEFQPIASFLIIKSQNPTSLPFPLSPRQFFPTPPAAAPRHRKIKMVKFLKPNKAVIVLNGRYAGRKAVIVQVLEGGNRDRPYGHCLVAGLAKYPKKVIRKDSAKKTAKKSRVKAFLKVVNFTHLMPTRYTLDVDLKDVVTADALSTRDKKIAACKETKKRLEERFKTGKNRWFFTKLRF
ncbi:hypothetical protein LUZ61_014639 [Rhynchospora tenuis]|uniref:60S ribosomal protein L27 n=2 Tax=Rhynchospora tenuis TaxID=198213 RepID=A0AAD5Z1C5_9POAL|nr:hypothetical protein LUZ61_014639 [Rhynchospora tenuis]